jgi:hypothetical protein
MYEMSPEPLPERGLELPANLETRSAMGPVSVTYTLKYHRQFGRTVLECAAASKNIQQYHDLRNAL